MDINKKIIALCNARGWSIYELSLQSGITQSSLTSMLNRGNPPKIENLQTICDAFGITLAQFFVTNEQYELLSPNEMLLISNYRKLPAEKQDALLKLISR